MSLRCSCLLSRSGGRGTCSAQTCPEYTGLIAAVHGTGLKVAFSLPGKCLPDTVTGYTQTYDTQALVAYTRAHVSTRAHAHAHTLTHTHTLTHSYTYVSTHYIHTRTPTYAQLGTHTHTHTHTLCLSLCLCLCLCLSLSLSLSLSLTLTHTHTHLFLLRLLYVCISFIILTSVLSQGEKKNATLFTRYIRYLLLMMIYI